MRWIVVFIVFGLVACQTPQEGDEQADREEKATAPVDSVAFFDAAILANPGSPEAYKDKTDHLLRLGDLDAALETIERGIKTDSTYAPLYATRGNIARKLRKVDIAYFDYKTCVSLDTTQIECLLGQAEFEIHLGNIKQARSLLNSVLYQNKYESEAYALRGYMYSILGDTTLALSSYQTATEVNANDYDSFISLGLLFSELGNDLAIDAYNSALDLEPRSTEALYAKASHLQNSASGDTTRLQQALDIYVEINNIDPTNSPAYYNQGYIYLEYLSEFENAEKRFTQAIAVYPKYYQAYYNRALARYGLENYNDALVDLNKALAIEPTYTEAAQMKQLVMEKLGRV